MNTYEDYIWKNIKRLEKEKEDLILQKDATYNFCGMMCKIYPIHVYEKILSRINAQIDILYMILTGHDNKYNDK